MKKKNCKKNHVLNFVRIIDFYENHLKLINEQ